jgi:hypothetical protein
MTRRTEIQLGFLVMGLIVWAYGQRTDNETLTWFGIGFFAAATVLRFFKRDQHRDDEVPPPEDPSDR